MAFGYGFVKSAKLLGISNTSDFLIEVASRAETRIGGSGAASGSLKHTYARQLIDFNESLAILEEA